MKKLIWENRCHEQVELEKLCHEHRDLKKVAFDQHNVCTACVSASRCVRTTYRALVRALSTGRVVRSITSPPIRVSNGSHDVPIGSNAYVELQHPFRRHHSDTCSIYLLCVWSLHVVTLSFMAASSDDEKSVKAPPARHLL